MKYNERQEIIYPASRVALIFPKNDGDCSQGRNYLACEQAEMRRRSLQRI